MTLRFALALVLVISLPAAGQVRTAASYVFPLFADGTSGSVVYRTSLKIVSTDPLNPAMECVLTQRQAAASFIGIYSDRYFADVFDSGDSPPAITTIFLGRQQPWEVLRSTAQGPLKPGYAGLSCSAGVHVEMQIALFDSRGLKLGETAILPAAEGSSFQFLINRRDGTRLGFSLANDSAIAGEYILIARDEFNQEVDRNYGTLGAWAQTSRFVDEVLSLPANFVGRIEVVGVKGGRNYAVGLQFTGGVFTVLTPLVRNTPF